MPFTKFFKLRSAALNDKVDVITELCALPKEEAPTEADITDVLQDAARAGSVKVVKYLCESGGADQDAVTGALIVACNTLFSRVEIIRYLCALTAANRPKQESIDLAVQKIYIFNEKENNRFEKKENIDSWEFLKTLCELPETYAPSAKVLGNLVQDKVNENLELPYDVLTHIFEKSTNKPDQTHVSAILKNICKWKVKKTDSVYWEHINYLCDLTGDNKPDQKTNELIFVKAYNANKLDLLGKLLMLDKKYAPGRKAVAEQLIDHVEADIYLDSLEIIKILCEKSTNTLTIDDMTKALVIVMSKKNVKNQPYYFEYLWNLILNNNPKPTDIDQIMQGAADLGDWAFVKKLCESKDYPPSEKGVSLLLKEMMRDELPFDEIKFMFETSVTKPTRSDVSTALTFICSKVNSADSERWDSINYLLALKGENSPDRNAIQRVLKLASKFTKHGLMRLLCTIEGKNGPGVTTIEEVLIDMVDHTNDLESLETIKCLCESSTDKPGRLRVSEALHHACIMYPAKENYVMYLSSLTTENKPTQVAIDRVLKWASEAGTWGFVKTLCANKNNPPSQIAIGQLLRMVNWSNSFPFDLLTSLFETSITKPSQEDIDATLMKMDMSKPEKIQFIDYLCDLKGLSEPSAKVITILFDSAVSAGNAHFVEKLALIDGDNALDPEVINNTLIALADKPDSLNM
ncbi:MAG: hypothetical protein H0T84_03495 [Tatlockia sp.]|nr:hypothetical protein [Tatlockia sp.]